MKIQVPARGTSIPKQTPLPFLTRLQTRSLRQEENESSSQRRTVGIRKVSAARGALGLQEIISISIWGILTCFDVVPLIHTLFMNELLACRALKEVIFIIVGHAVQQHVPA